MPKRGDIARESVKNTIINAFAATGDYVTMQDKKIIVQARDGNNGEIIQFAITMTMPKTSVTAETLGASPLDMTTTSVGAPSHPLSVEPAEMSPEDKAAIERLKKALGVV